MKRNVNKRARKRAMRKAKIRKLVKEANMVKKATRNLDPSYTAHISKFNKTAKVLVQLAKDVQKNKDTRATVKKFKNSLNKFDKKVMGKGYTGVINFAESKASPYARNNGLSDKELKDLTTVMSSAVSGFKTTRRKNGTHKPVFKKRKVDKNGKKGDWESDEEAKKHQSEYKQEYQKNRRRFNDNKQKILTVFFAFEEAFGDSLGKVFSSEEVIEAVEDYVENNDVDINSAEDIEKAVNALAHKLGIIH